MSTSNAEPQEAHSSHADPPPSAQAHKSSASAGKSTDQSQVNFGSTMMEK